MNIGWIIPVSICAGWIVNTVADTVPERRSFAETWRWPLQSIAEAIGVRKSTEIGIGRATTTRYLITWILAIALGCLSAIRSGTPIEAFVLAIYAWFLLGIGIIDIEHRLVLNRMLLPALPVVIIGNLIAGLPTLLSAFTGGVVGFGIFLLIALIKPGSMGMGDVKLAGVIGLATGIPGILLTILLCIFSGGFAAFFILLRSRFQRGQTMAYAPYLVLGAWATLYFGTDLWRIYMQL